MCRKWLCYAVFLIFREDTKCNGGFSIPVRVTRLKSPERLFKAVRGIRYFRKSSFDHCLIIILKCFVFISCFRSIGVA